MGLFFVTVAVAFGLCAQLPEAAHCFLSLALALCFLARTGVNIYKKRRVETEHILGALILSGFLLYRLLRQAGGAFSSALDAVAGGVSALAGQLVLKHISMGATYSGLDVAVLFLLAVAVTAALYRVPPKKWLLSVAGIVVLWCAYIGIWSFLAESSLALGLNKLEPATGPLDYRLLLFLFLLAGYLLVYGRVIREGSGGARKKWTAPLSAGLLALSLALSILAPLAVRAPVRREGAHITFLDTGIDWSVPESGTYGLDYAGMFGILPHYLNRQGYGCRVVDSLEGNILRDTDVLVVINPMRMLSEQELSDTWAFVEAGGSVLAVGDHTGDEQVRLPLNALLAPVGISLNFDSAIPFQSLWANHFELRQSPILQNVDSRQVQMVVGASLDVGWNARPLIVGRAGYSDIGDITNTADGYLGDMHFNRGERIGDLVLAAEASYGKGTFVVFGDTTHLQNTVISYSYPLVDNLFAYLSDTGAPRETAWEDDEFFQGSALIDATHLEIVARDKSGDAADGLIACSLRAGCMPYLNQSEPIADAALRHGAAAIFLIEPAKPFTDAELRFFEAYMREGGSVVLCAGYGSPAASKNFAAHFGFSFDPMPVGRIAPDQNPDMAFWNACPLLYEGRAPEKSGDVTSLMEIWGYSTMAKKSIGDGAIYVFADPDFLKNKNLESVDTYRSGNVAFVETLFADMLEGRR